ncbi:hypothetical protein EGR_11115 [Echinococcus granulosus]|uniref:Uncharacterized protein n=1 Tax=Echinococcus granulosus TaxID=6210 RepID=W6TZ77_ECHGR|nr:hypothetical protein EGR_11115 [Echinococcus granulosus]EUB54028.1 hypothetical protein EGR_11115 [Echinococcus granulosus]
MPAGQDEKPPNLVFLLQRFTEFENVNHLLAGRLNAKPRFLHTT